MRTSNSSHVTPNHQQVSLAWAGTPNDGPCGRMTVMRTLQLVSAERTLESHVKSSIEGITVGARPTASTSMATLADVLITAVPHGLSNVESEARAAQMAFGTERAELRLNITFDQLERVLDGKAIWWFGGHGDAPLCGESVPAFLSEDGAIERVSIRAIAEMVRLQVNASRRLQLVVLAGCCSVKLGRALQEVGCVRTVVCWETVLHDQAGRVFGAKLKVCQRISVHAHATRGI
jgi:hypothetical protein